eukprot:12863791-Alexandrium_andersonii.AAC.1
MFGYLAPRPARGDYRPRPQQAQQSGGARGIKIRGSTAHAAVSARFSAVSARFRRGFGAVSARLQR